MITFATWKWGNQYSLDYVRRLRAGVARHLKEPHRFVCISDDPRVGQIDGVLYYALPDPGLTQIKGCFARLRMFDPAWQHACGVDGRLVCCDLDVVITAALDPLFNRPETFVILQGANAKNPCPYNGSLMMLRAGSHAEIWTGFTLDEALTIPRYDFPDDQGWLWNKLPNAAGWQVGPSSGVYAYMKPGWPRGDALPKDTRMVAFPGWRDPNNFLHIDWVRSHWVQ